jgi:hypothetical protein
MAGQPVTRGRRAAAAVAERPNGPPRAIVHTVLERSGRAGLPFADAWALAVPLALTGAESHEAEALARGFERERPDWRADYHTLAGQGTFSAPPTYRRVVRATPLPNGRENGAEVARMDTALRPWAGGLDPRGNGKE